MFVTAVELVTNIYITLYITLYQTKLFLKMCMNCLILGSICISFLWVKLKFQQPIVSTKEAMPFKDVILLSTDFILLKT